MLRRSALWTVLAAIGLALPAVAQAEQTARWQASRSLAAPEAHQAAAADDAHVYAISSTEIARYDRFSGEPTGRSTGEAQHLNSGFLFEGRLYCAHSNYPLTPELSQIKDLDLESLTLTTFHDFGDYGGSLTWVVRHDGGWWCNFARYGRANSETFLVRFDDEWRELQRWTYPDELIARLGNYSLSGGIWHEDALLVTGHDDRVLFRLGVPEEGRVLQLVDEMEAPFTGQGIAADPVTGGLVGIDRRRRLIVFAEMDAADEQQPSAAEYDDRLPPGPGDTPQPRKKGAP